MPRVLGRKRLYKVYVKESFGRIGYGDALKTSECVLKGIREYAHESEEEDYMSHHDV